jgi:signal transduction histidine kinase
MDYISALFLLSLHDILRMDVMVWVVGIPLVIAAVFMIVYQIRKRREIQADLKQLAKVSRHTIEYALILKTMKLSIWRLDVASHKMTFESDYRDSDTVVFPPGTRVDELAKLVKSEDAEKVSKGIDDLVEGRIDECHIQYEVNIPHSERTYWEESYAVVDKRDLDGKPVTIVGTSQRIDKQKDIEKALIDARNHAEESDRLKSAFLANISHEVRTPLNAIVGFSEVLSMAQSEEERQQLIGLIRDNNARLLRLFDDMMHMSRLEAGDDSIKKSSFELKPLLEEMVVRYASRLDAKRVKLFVMPTDSNPRVLTDRERLGEIMNQYVNNAVKFTTDGQIILGFENIEHQLRIWVEDTGKGIPEDHCNDHLFERFVKVDEFVPGTGLGLSICRSMALSLGGKVGVESTLGKGSKFWVDIPTE